MKAHARNHHPRHLRAVRLQDDLAKIGKAFTNAGEHVKDRAEQAITDSYENILDTSADIQQTVADYVAEKPYKSLGMALLTGMVLGFLIRK